MPRRLCIVVVAHLEGGQAVLVAEDRQQVVTEGVRHVLGPVGVWALAGDGALHGKALPQPQAGVNSASTLSAVVAAATVEHCRGKQLHTAI